MLRRKYYYIVFKFSVKERNINGNMVGYARYRKGKFDFNECLDGAINIVSNEIKIDKKEIRIYITNRIEMSKYEYENR